MCCCAWCDCLLQTDSNPVFPEGGSWHGNLWKWSLAQWETFFTHPLVQFSTKKREESLSLPSFHGCLLIPPNCAALRTVRMCCKTSLTARLMLRPHGLMVGKQGSDSSYPGTPATSFYDPQSPPSARWHRSIIRMSEEETKLLRLLYINYSLHQFAPQCPILGSVDNGLGILGHVV